MKCVALILFSLLASATIACAGTQQDYFVASVKKATRVSIVRIGPAKTPEGALRTYQLLNSPERKQIERVAQSITMLDPKPTGYDGKGEIWAMSRLTFGVAETSITFYRGEEAFLRYDLDSSLRFVAVVGAHAPHPIDGMLDHPLTHSSTRRLNRLIKELEKTR